MGQARNLFPRVSEIHPAAITGPYRSDIKPTPGSGSGRFVASVVRNNMALRATHHTTTHKHNRRR
jgi:hypothetical protein